MARKSRPADSAKPTGTSLSHLIAYPTVALLSAALGFAAAHRPNPTPTFSAGASKAAAAQINLDRTVGNAAFDQQNWPLAIQSYSAAASNGLSDPDVLTDLGTAYRFDNQPRLALQEYQWVQSGWPTHENSLFNQGALYAFSLNRPDLALSVWRTYLIRFPHGTHVIQAELLIAEVKAHTTSRAAGQ